MSETKRVVIEDGWLWYEKQGDEWHLFTKNGGNGEVTSRVVTAMRSHVPVWSLLDALATAQEEARRLREALESIRDAHSVTPIYAINRALSRGEAGDAAR